MVKSKKAHVINIAASITLVAMTLPGIALAHHSFAMFDNTKTLTITGTVSKWEWTAPHSWLSVVVKDLDGKANEWNIEGGSPSLFNRLGGSRSMIKVGDVVVATIHPRRDGAHSGAWVSVKLSDGRIIGGPGASAPAGPGK